MRSAATLLLSLLPLTNSARLTFSDGGNYTISSNYDDTNIFVLNSTSLTLSPDAYAINAPSSTDDGESAIRVENAYLYVHGGQIAGAANIGGSGVTVTTDKDRDSKSYATFEDGVEIIGGSAGRESTTKGGDAVQIIQQGAEVCFICTFISCCRTIIQEILNITYMFYRQHSMEGNSHQEQAVH